MTGKFFLAATFVAGLLTFGARADEGLWTFNNPPKALLKSRYNFDATAAWLDHVRLASVRFNNGGSGSFVSANGLVMTNHHVGADCLQKVSAAGQDFYRNGYYAKSADEERQCPDLELNVVTGIADVTARVNAAVKAGMDDAARNTAQRGAMATLEKECADRTGQRCDVVTLYQGGMFNLYQYKKYTDVRLVFAPEFDIAFFGGDPDNFMYPRYDLDICFFRVYEGDKPARIEHYLKWSKRGARADELIFVSGNPGTTGRLHTVARLEQLRDHGLPFALRRLERERAALLAYSASGSEPERQAKEEIFSIENSLKALKGEYEGLKTKALMDKKKAEEQALRKAIARDPRRRSEYGGAWDAVTAACKKFTGYYKTYTLLEGGAGFNSTLFGMARHLLRLTDEKPAPNEKRLREYRESNLPSLEQQLFSPAPIYDDLEVAKLGSSLTLLHEELGANDPLITQIFNGRTPEAAARAFIQNTKLKDVAVRKDLARGGRTAFAESNDAMIKLAQLVDAKSRILRKQYEDEVQGVERRNYALISKALFDSKGTRLYPDATFTLRLSFGVVKGYRENGKPVPCTTALKGAYEHAYAHGDRPPYQLPKSWLEKKATLDLSTPFNFVATADIIGGNSGSPVINRNAELVGIIFDGNIQSLILNYVYDDQQARAVAVHSEGILETLTKIYDARRILEELQPVAK
ncbi:MAG: S46 family peptidase [Acidobacteria bacterium]|nr:S46 family peptidase [Acidobacteriota bacterium]MBI3656142.1 S46 family peptidase [Acidobacteriota bacterium]